jgi:hypothetical protein
MDIEEIKKQLLRLSSPQLETFLQNLDHVSFSFTINMSFLKYGNHPITIPKEFYPFLSVHGITETHDLRLLFPDGSTATAYIYRGKAGYGEYFQIKIRQSYSQRGRGVSQFREGDRIRVEIFKSGDKEQIQLSKML